jgi:isopenicillin N synthase-like dioxygenase
MAGVGPSDAVDRVPVIDLTPAADGGRDERRRVAGLIDRACVEIGFFAVTGHGVPVSIGRALRDAAHAFFALPAEIKQRASPADARTPRGYHGIGGEALSAANDAVAPPDLKEFYHVGPVDVGDDAYYTGAKGRQFFLPNIWPAEPPAFRDAAVAYYRAMDRLVRSLMRLTALALDLDEGFFDDKVDRSIGTMRLNYYPRQRQAPLAGQLRAGAHTDYGGMTILSGEDVPGGLQVRTRRGEWIDVRTSPDELVVNIGDLLMRWTNDRWLSNLHRVVNPPLAEGQNRPRLSIAFFNHPNWDVPIACLAPAGEAKYPPVLSGDYRDLKYAKTGFATTTA